jgi:hypothetical protein
MPLYPQLTANSICQYPIRRTRHYRTIANTLEDGSRITLADPMAATIRWELTYIGLTDTEVATLRSFFETAEGRLNAFAFADPTGNLLVWSEDFTQQIWQRNSLLQIQPQIDDPLGSARATRFTNGGSGSLGITQTVQVPGAWKCCWSVYLRSDAPETLVMTRDSTSLSLNVTNVWQRFQLSNTTGSSGNSSDFGLTIPAGAQIDLFGPQVEAQAGASTYIPTLSATGVFPNTRFDSDALQIKVDGPNRSSSKIALMSYVA